jgi:hypothetical protein
MQFVASGVPKLWTAVGETVRSVTVTTVLVTNCARSPFLERFYQVGLSSNDSSRLADVFSVTEALGRVAFLRQYLILLPALKALIILEGWRPFAVSLVATISVYSEGRTALIKDGFTELMMPYREDPRLKPYVAAYLKHISEDSAGS